MTNSAALSFPKRCLAGFACLYTHRCLPILCTLWLISCGSLKAQRLLIPTEQKCDNRKSSYPSLTTYLFICKRRHVFSCKRGHLFSCKRIHVLLQETSFLGFRNITKSRKICKKDHPKMGTEHAKRLVLDTAKDMLLLGKTILLQRWSLKKEDWNLHKIDARTCFRVVSRFCNFL